MDKGARSRADGGPDFLGSPDVPEVVGLTPKVGVKSKLRTGGNIPSEKAKKKPKRQNMGKPSVEAPANPRVHKRAGTPAEMTEGQENARGSHATDADLDAAVGSSERSRQRLFYIEFCSGPNSRLGNQSGTPDEHCEVMRLTEAEDMTTQEGKTFTVAKTEEFEQEMKKHGAATDRRTSLWISMPCTGGSPWQHVNETV
eukprot:182721-Pyramimonas_sp.AAC.2